MKIKSKEVRIETTTLCNCHCVTCPRETFYRRKETMPTDLFMRAVTEAHGVGAEHINLTGFGEPLVDPAIAERVALCDVWDMNSHITTNGALLDDKLAEKLIGAGLTNLRFSVHGLFEKYEQVHRGLNFEVVFGNIRRFVRMNEKTGHRVEVSVVAVPMGGERIEGLVDFWRPREFVDHLEIWRPHNWTTGRNYRWLKPLKRKRTCGRPQSGPIQILVDGTVVACCFDYNGELWLGNIKTHSLEAILGGPAFQLLRDRHQTGNLEGLLCEACDQLNIEDESPLLYSSRDPERQVGRTSSIKHDLERG